MGEDLPVRDEAQPLLLRMQMRRRSQGNYKDQAYHARVVRTAEPSRGDHTSVAADDPGIVPCRYPAAGTASSDRERWDSRRLSRDL